jgi:nitrate/nitrite-specific signal transduction histidine kinase
MTRMNRRRRFGAGERWLAVIAAIVLVAIVELLSDSALEPALPFPLDTLAVMAVVSVVAGLAAMLVFRRIDNLGRDVIERNAALESRNATLRALYDVSLSVAGQAEPEETIDSIVGHARRLLRADGALLVLDGPGGVLRLRAASAAPAVLRPATDATQPPDYDEIDCFLQDGYKIAVTVPVGYGDKRVGTLGLAIREEGSLAAPDTGMLSALATQVGLALEAARLQNERQVLAIQTERERIAREMHDGLAQVLGYVNTKSQAVVELLDHNRVPEARRQLGELTSAARTVYADVREAILNLSTPLSPERSLATALEEYSAVFAKAATIHAVFSATPEAAQAPLSAAAQAEVFSIAREALTNVRKHARAGRVELDLGLELRDLVLRIADDGVGFDADVFTVGPEKWPHFCLAGMRERAAMVGGSIEWHSRAGHGTVVELRVPVAMLSWSSTPEPPAPLGGTERSTERHQAVR